MKYSACALLLAAASSCALQPVDGEDELGALQQNAEVALNAADQAFLDAPDGVWTDVTFDNTQCRDGSPMTLRIHRNKQSDKVVLFMDGGGICFDAATCAISDPNVIYQLNEQWQTLDGLFNLENPRNPVRDWNVVYMPYCTSDLGAGTRTNVVIPGVPGVQQFVGRNNLKRLLRPITQLSKAQSQVLLVGVSAGGYGATLNLPMIQKSYDDAFGKSTAPKVRLVNDSGAFLDKTSLPVCLQQTWRTMFGWDSSFLADWPDGNSLRTGDFMTQYATWVAKTYSDRQNGFLSTVEDGVIRGFLGVGKNNCSGVLFETPVEGPVYTRSLLNFRRTLKGTSTSTFYSPGGEHVYLEWPGFYTVTAGGTPLVDWFTKIVNNQSAGNRGLEEAETPPAGFTLCAGENGTCAFTGPATVAYGAYGLYAYKELTNGTPCTNAVFGDPVSGVFKSCYLRPAVRWSSCAGEGGTCTMANGKGVVRYGANGKFLFKEVEISIPCTNAAFGGDPARGFSKECRRAALPIEGGWSRCAGEGGTCAVTGSRTLAYGVRGKLVYRQVSTATACTNKAIGVDPAPGQVKSCYLD
jgi:Pectinacetylesterase